MDDGDHAVSVGEARVVHERAKAILVELEDEPGDGPFWIPKSAVHEDSEVWSEKHGQGGLVVKTWFARKEGWD